jgi:hypothetical protein
MPSDPGDPRADNAGGGRALAFVTAAELRRATPVEPPWVWRHYIAAGTLTVLAGKPKTGKSTLAFAFAFALVEALAAGADTFLGCQLAGGPVVYVSEEGAASLRHKLPDSDRVHVLTREAACRGRRGPSS